MDSIDDAISKAKQNGAIIVRDKMEFDEFYLAYMVDPTGLGFGLIQSIEKSLQTIAEAFLLKSHCKQYPSKVCCK
ncbi:VOC family protein [Lysinibacillus xylanilyticus]|uniref:VOC family protein n=1 Tax=Lysinibacillus xylanilyticus TaxID=582475 RepID=UPI0038215807